MHESWQEHEEYKKKLHVKYNLMKNKAVDVYDDPLRYGQYNNNNNYRNSPKCIGHKKLQAIFNAHNDVTSSNSFLAFLNNEYCSVGVGRSVSISASQEFHETYEKKPKTKNNTGYSQNDVNNLNIRKINRSKSNLYSKYTSKQNPVKRSSWDFKEDSRTARSTKYIKEPMKKNMKLQNMISKLINIRQKEQSQENWDRRKKHYSNKKYFQPKPILVEPEIVKSQNYVMNNLAKGVKTQKYVMNNLAKGDSLRIEHENSPHLLNSSLSNNLIVYSEDSDIELAGQVDFENNETSDEVGYHKLSPSTTRILLTRDINSVSSIVVNYSDINPIASMDCKSSRREITVERQPTIDYRNKPHQLVKNERQRIKNVSQNFLQPEYERLPKEIEYLSSQPAQEISHQIIVKTSQTIKENFENFINDSLDLNVKKTISSESIKKSRKVSLAKIETKLDVLIDSFHTFIGEVNYPYMGFCEKDFLVKSQIKPSNCKNIVRGGMIDFSKIKGISSTGKLNIPILNNSSEQKGNSTSSPHKDIKRKVLTNRRNKPTKSLNLPDNNINVKLLRHEKNIEESKRLSESKHENDNNKKNSMNHAKIKEFENAAINTEALSFYALLHVCFETVWVTIKKLPSVWYNWSIAYVSSASDKYNCNKCCEIFTTSNALGRQSELHTIDKMSQSVTERMEMEEHQLSGSFSCNYCGQSFLRAYCYQLHEHECSKRHGKRMEDLPSPLLLLK